jgi:hypothetical protein
MLKDRIPVEYTQMQGNKRTVVYTAPKKKGTPSLNNKTRPSKLTQSQLHKGGAIITGSKHVVPVSESSDRSKNKRFVSGLDNHKAMAWTQGPNQINRLQEPRCQIPPISRSGQATRSANERAEGGSARPLGLGMFLRRGVRR